MDTHPYFFSSYYHKNFLEVALQNALESNVSIVQKEV